MSDTETPAPQAQDPAAAETSEQEGQSEAGEQTQEAPEATQGEQTTEGSEQTEVKAEETAGEKLYAGKYKSVDELEKAYQSATSEASRISQEKAELTRILNDAFSSSEPANSQSQATDDDSYQEEPTAATGDDGTKRDVAVMKFIMSHGDADGQSMKEVLASDPYVKQISGHEAKLEYAYLRSQNMVKSKAIAEAEKKGAQTATAKAAEKEVAQVESGKKAEPVDENAELMSKATRGKPSERKDARMAIIRKDLVNL